MSVDHRAIITRCFTDDKTPENRRIGQRNFKHGCLDIKSSADNRPISPISLAPDGRFEGNVTVT